MEIVIVVPLICCCAWKPFYASSALVIIDRFPKTTKAGSHGAAGFYDIQKRVEMINKENATITDFYYHLNVLQKYRTIS